MNRPDQHQPGRSTASQAYAAYEAKEAAASASRGLIDPAGDLAQRLNQEAVAAYAEYEAAWFHENHPQAETEPEL